MGPGAEVEGVPGGARLHSGIVVAQRAAHALFFDVVIAEFHLESAQVVQEQAKAPQVALVAGELRHAVAHAVHAFMGLMGAVDGHGAPIEDFRAIERLSLKAEASPADVGLRGILDGHLGHEVDGAPERLGGGQAAAGSPGNVDPLQAVHSQHVQSIGIGDRREDRHAVQGQRRVASGQVVQGDAPDVAHRALHLDVDARPVGQRVGQAGRASLRHFRGVDGFGLDDIVAQGARLGRGFHPLFHHHRGRGGLQGDVQLQGQVGTHHQVPVGGDEAGRPDREAVVAGGQADEGEVAPGIGFHRLTMAGDLARQDQYGPG